MAGFSSRGPTWDGRIKPDVLAPGWTLSAQTNQRAGAPDAAHCHVRDSVGSMQVRRFRISIALLRSVLIFKGPLKSLLNFKGPIETPL